MATIEQIIKVQNNRSGARSDVWTALAGAAQSDTDSTTPPANFEINNVHLSDTVAVDVAADEAGHILRAGDQVPASFTQGGGFTSLGATILLGGGDANQLRVLGGWIADEGRPIDGLTVGSTIRFSNDGGNTFRGDGGVFDFMVDAVAQLGPGNNAIITLDRTPVPGDALDNGDTIFGGAAATTIPGLDLTNLDRSAFPDSVGGNDVHIASGVDTNGHAT